MTNSNPIENLLGAVERIVFRPSKPQPHYTLKAQLERSIVFENIEENRAKLETFRAQECEFRAILCAAYANMAYEAERARYKTENRVWDEGSNLAIEIERIQAALEAHGNCLDEITYLQNRIQDDQNDLDDGELWEQVPEEAVRA